jgi:hypothetical protein
MYFHEPKSETTEITELFMTFTNTKRVKIGHLLRTGCKWHRSCQRGKVYNGLFVAYMYFGILGRGLSPFP